MRAEYKKLLKNTSLFGIATFSTSLLNMLMTPFYTSVLSTADYGVSDLITVTTSLLFPLLSLTTCEAVFRFSLEKGADHKAILSIGLLSVLLATVVVVLFSPLASLTVIGPYVLYFIIYFFSACFHATITNFSKGLEKIRINTEAGIIGTIVVICSNLFFLLYLKTGVNGYLISLILAHLTPSLYMILRGKLYKYFSFSFSIDRALLKGMLSYSIPLIPNGISWWIANSSDRYILNHYVDVSEVGLYSVSYKIPSIMMLLMGFLISAWKLSSVEDFGTEKSKAFFSTIYNKYVMVSVLIASLIIITAKPFASFLYAKDFFVAWRFVPILVIANVFYTLSSFMGTIYTGAKKTKMLSISTVVGAVINIVLNFILIPLWGAMGAAIATAFSYVLIHVIRLIHSPKILEFSIHHFRDLLFYIMLIIQSVCVLSESKIGIIISIIITTILIVCCRSLYNDMIVIARSVLKLKKR